MQGHSNKSSLLLCHLVRKKRPDPYSKEIVSPERIVFYLSAGDFILSIIQVITRLSLVLLLTHALISGKIYVLGNVANLDDFRAENNNHSNKTQEIQHA